MDFIQSISDVLISRATFDYFFRLAINQKHQPVHGLVNSIIIGRTLNLVYVDAIRQLEQTLKPILFDFLGD